MRLLFPAPVLSATIADGPNSGVLPAHYARGWKNEAASTGKLNYLNVMGGVWSNPLVKLGSLCQHSFRHGHGCRQSSSVLIDSRIVRSDPQRGDSGVSFDFLNRLN